MKYGIIMYVLCVGVIITVRGRMFNRYVWREGIIPPPPSIIHCHRLDYMHLVFSSLPEHRGRFLTLPPCIVKPEKLWSGKQVVSTLLINVVPEGLEKLNLISKAKIAIKVSSLIITILDPRI